MDVDPDRFNGFLYNTGGLELPGVKFKVIVIHAGFGDATLIEATDNKNKKKHYLIDGGPTTNPGTAGVRVAFFQNLLETFLKYAFKEDGSNTFKADGIMVTHPDADHIQGIIQLFEMYPPNQDPSPGKAKFEFSGPLLLNKFFDSTNYGWIINAIKDAKFGEQNFTSGDQIDGFEKHFTFFYPFEKAPGTLYTYHPPSFTPSLFALMASARYSPSTSNANLSSTILVINNPSSGDPLVSLNGDGIGHSIIQSLNGKYPKIFKVSHHGSIHNSIALEKYVPDNLGPTQKLLATSVLLQVAQQDDRTLLQKQITQTSLGTFHTRFTEQPSHAMSVRQKRARLNPILFDDALQNLVTKFNNALVNKGINSVVLLQNLENFIKTIDENSKNPSVKSVDLYTHNIPNKDELDKFITTYDAVKREILYRDVQTKEKEAFEAIYNMLETDRVFSGKVGVTLCRHFYSKVNAQTYFISSGDFHDHPNWEVVNGIIAAAHDQHLTDPNYKCRILLTTGHNIKADKIGELALSDDWMQYASLQYFASYTASIEIDPNERNPLLVLPGAIKWQGAMSEQKQRDLLKEYNQTKGAQELKAARSAKTDHYEINPSTDKSSWLTFQSNSLVLSSTKVAISVHNMGAVYEKSIQNIVTQFEFKQAPSHNAIVYGVLGTHPPASKVITYLLYTLSGGNKMRMYFTVKDGNLTTTTEKENAVNFQFTFAVATLPKMFFSLSDIDQPSGMASHQPMSSMQPLPPRNKRTVDDASGAITLQQFLTLVQIDEKQISCQQLLDIVLSKQFTTQFLSDSSESNIGNFIANLFKLNVDNSSTFTVEDSEATSADVKLTLPEAPLELHNYTITGVKFVITDPKTIIQQVNLQLDTTDDDTPVTLTYNLKSETFVRNFHKYLISMGITKNPSTLKMFDAIILLIQSETSAFVYLSSLSRKMLGDVLEWKINEEATSVEFVEFPTGPVVTSANIIAQIPGDNPTIALGWKNLFKVKKIGFTLSNQLESAESMYLFANGTVGKFELQLKAFPPEDNILPTFEVLLPKSLSLSGIIDLLQVSVGISKFPIPLTSNVLSDIRITETMVTYQQGIEDGQQVYLKKIAFGFQFENLANYLPDSFSNLHSVSARFAIFQPKLVPVQIGVEISFEFLAAISGDKSISLIASFSTEPVLANAKTESRNFTVSLSAKSNVIGTIEGGVSLASFLKVFGLSNALQAAENIPLLSSSLANIELKQLVLGMNTSSKNINAFVLELLVLNWVIVPEKVAIEEASITMSYINKNWASKFDATVTLNKHYNVDAHFEINNSIHQSNFSFNNSNSDFTISKFLEIFGLGNLNSLPVLGQLLNITVKEASVKMTKRSDGNVTFTEGKVSLNAEEINIGSLFKLSQVVATIGFIFDATKQSYVFGFSVKGFINNKVYLDVEYDPNTSVLSGQVSISISSAGNFTEILSALIKNGKESIGKNVLFTNIQNSSTVGIDIAMKYASSNFTLTDLVIHLNKEISIGLISLQRLKFEYHRKVNEEMKVEDSYILVGELVSEKHRLGGVLEFDLTKVTTGVSSVTASLKPIRGNSLTLKSLLSVLGIVAPPVPEIEGKTLPKFFDIAVTKGTISVSVPVFQILAFSINVSAVNTLVILDSPQIRLENISLQLDHNSNPNPVTTAILLGEFVIGDVHVLLSGTTVTGSKEGKETVFTLSAGWNHRFINAQQAFNQLTPVGSVTPVIPTDIGVPQDFQVLATTLDIRLLYTSKKRSVEFRGGSSYTWSIDLGFKQFTVEELGGAVSYLKSIDNISSEFKTNLVGKFRFSNNILMACKLSFGSKVDTVLSAVAAEVSNTNVSSIADDVLGFDHPKVPNSDGTKFQNLLPHSVQPINFSKFFANINFTQSMFLCFGELVSIGHGLLLAGNFSTDSKQYGYVFGVSLPQGFKFSDIIPALSPIDEILTLQKVNCMIVSVQNTKVESIISKLKSAKESAIFTTDYKGAFPFIDLSLDSFSSGQVLIPGMSLYGELQLHTAKLGSLFNSLIQITGEGENVSNIIVSSLISTDPSKSEFKAYIANLTLLGAIRFSKITFTYRPAKKAYFELVGAISLLLGEQVYDFLGAFSCNSTQSEFTVSTEHAISVTGPLGMFGITLNNAHLQITYKYPHDKLHSSSQIISANVNFHSKVKPVKLLPREQRPVSKEPPPDEEPPHNEEPPTEEPPVPSIVLDCKIIFNNYKPTVVKISLHPTAPLTIADFVYTVLGWNFDINKYLNIGFVNGQVYFSKLEEGTKSITVDGVTYNKGYHISADIEVFNELFTITADISSNQVSINGHAHAPLDLGFAKFTGVDGSDPSKPDVSKSPQLSFITNSSSTSISLNVGFVLFDFPLGIANLGYKSTSDNSKVFFGKLTYNGKLGFIENPSIDFEWSKEDGFKVTNLPVVGSFKDAFDFFDGIRNYKDSCGELVDLAFKKGVQTRFNIKVKLSKSSKPEEFLADIAITGTYDVMLLTKVKVASVPIPDISVGIPKEDKFTLSNLPQFILDLFAKNSVRIIQQITDYPERMTKILAICLLKQVTKKVIGTLVCRNVDADDFDPEDGGDDITSEDTNEGESTETEFTEAADEFETIIETSESIIDVGEAAGLASSLGSDAASVFAGIIASIGSILAFLGISSYRQKKKDAEKHKQQIEDRLHRINEQMRNALDIRGNPSATFTPPDVLTASWNPITKEGARYHVHVKGILLTPEMDDTLGQTSTSSETIFDGVLSNVELNLKSERFYNVVGLTLSVNGTVTTKGNHTYIGNTYTIDVPNIHPTLHPPSGLRAAYHHSSLQISVVAEPVEHAEKYFIELIESKEVSLAKRIVTLASISNEIQCNFPHSSINASLGNTFKVRCQSIAKSESNIASSEFAFSNELSIVEPVRNLKLTIPHFSNPNTFVKLSWELPISVDNTVGFLSQVVLEKSGKVLLTKKVSPSSDMALLPATCSIEIDDLTSTLAKEPSLTNPPSLTFQVSATSNSEMIIDSKFVDQTVASLPTPQTITCNFSNVANTLAVSWIYAQLTHKYGVEILGLKSESLFSKLAEVNKDHEIEPGKVGITIPVADLQNISNPNVQYTVEVRSVTDGNDTMDSLVPGNAENVLQIMQAPIANAFKYVPGEDHESMVMTFEGVSQATKYFTKIFSNGKTVASSTVMSGEQSATTSTTPLDRFIDEVSSGDSVTASVQSLGNGYWLSSKPTNFTQHLKVLPKPNDIEFAFSPEDWMITLTCSAVEENEYSYKLGFVGHSKDGAVSRIIKLAVRSSEGNLTSTFLIRDLKMSGIYSYKVFAQTAVIANNNSTWLPSPRLFLKDMVNILSAPSIKSVLFNNSFSALTLITQSMQNTSKYKFAIEIYGSSSTAFKTVTKIFSTTDNETFTVRINLSEEIPEWNSVLSILTMISISVTAMGSGYYLTSDPSEPKQIRRESSPTNLTYSYSSTDDTITMTCQNLQSDKTSAVLGLMDPAGIVKRISMMTSSQMDGKYQVKIAGKEVRNVNKDGQHWIVFAQSLGDNHSLPSSVTMLPDHVEVLTETEIKSGAYDEETTRLSFDWYHHDGAAAYRAIVSYSTEEGVVLVTDKETTTTNLTVYFDKVVSHWQNVFNSVTLITATVKALGTGRYINGTQSEYELARVTSPSGLSYGATDSELTIYWDSNHGTTYNITANGDYGPVKRTTVVGATDSYTLQKRSLLYPSTSPRVKTIKVNMTAIKEGYLPSIATNMQTSIETQAIAESKVFGTPSGKSFKDGASQPGIVGMKSLVIYHESSIHGLQASYYLVDGSGYRAPLHGGQTGHQSVLTFTKQESIIAISALLSTTTKLSQLIIVTQQADGSYKRYGPYGAAVPSNPEQQIKFSGNVLFLKGNNDENFINAVGFIFTYAHPIILASKQFGGLGGNAFDGHTLTHIPRLTTIKGLNLTYAEDHVSTIQLTYLTEDGDLWEAPAHGTKKDHSVDLWFEDGEVVIQVKGDTYLDPDLQHPSNIVKQLYFKTHKRDGTTKIYGPYPNSGEEPFDYTFVITGKLMGVCGRSGWFLDSLGFYYSLQRSELFGGNGGGTFDVNNIISNISGIKTLKVRSSYKIDAIEVTYYDTLRKPLETMTHGGFTSEGVDNLLEFEEDEEIIQVKLGEYYDDTLEIPHYLIGKLQIMTQRRDGSKKQYGPFGNKSTKEYTLDGRVVGFFGRSGWFLDAIGMYYIPITSDF